MQISTLLLYLVEKSSNTWYNNKSLYLKGGHIMMKTEKNTTAEGRISQTTKTILASILNNPCEEAFACECADKCDGKTCQCIVSER